MGQDTHCGELLEELSDYLDDAASQELCAEIEAHLAECPDCEILINTLRKTVVLYRGRVESRPLPQGVRRRLYQVLDLSEYLEG
jgi:predicted anti-sigma-YlaC factor YlaD